MPRINVQKTRKPRVCPKCSAAIPAGTEYRSWANFRQPVQFRCMAPSCNPTEAELTGSEKMQRLFEARDNGLAGIAEAEDIESIAEALREAAEVAEEVAGEYTEAAEHFGGQGPMQEKADAVEEWNSALTDAADSAEDTVDESAIESENVFDLIRTALADEDLDKDGLVMPLALVDGQEDPVYDEATEKEVPLFDAVMATLSENDKITFKAAYDAALEEKIEEAKNEALEEARTAAETALEGLDVS